MKPTLKISYSLAMGSVTVIHDATAELTDMPDLPVVKYRWEDGYDYSVEQLVEYFQCNSSKLLRLLTEKLPTVRCELPLSDVEQALYAKMMRQLVNHQVDVQIASTQNELSSVRNKLTEAQEEIGKYKCELRSVSNFGNEIAEALTNRGIDLDGPDRIEEDDEQGGLQNPF